MLKDGGPAYPQPIPKEESVESRAGVTLNYRGMSLRDWFAGQALPECVLLSSNIHRTQTLPWTNAAVKAAYEIADAMLKEREHVK